MCEFRTSFDIFLVLSESKVSSFIKRLQVVDFYFAEINRHLNRIENWYNTDFLFRDCSREFLLKSDLVSVYLFLFWLIYVKIKRLYRSIS